MDGRLALIRCSAARRIQPRRLEGHAGRAALERQLKADAIPLSARIFAVVDVWYALFSNCPYRRSWSAAQVREYIRGQPGQNFDPKIVDAILARTLSGQTNVDPRPRFDSPYPPMPSLIARDRKYPT